MDKTTLGKRDALAMARLQTAAATLAQRFNVPLPEPVGQVGTTDPAVKLMLQRERLADLLDQVVAITAAYNPQGGQPDTPAQNMVAAADTDGTMAHPGGHDGDDDEMADWQQVSGVGDELAMALVQAGYITRADVKRASDADLLKVSGLGRQTLKKLRAYVDEPRG